MLYDRKHLTEKLKTVQDKRMENLRTDWFNHPQKQIGYQQFIAEAKPWFSSSKMTDVDGWQTFPYVDVTMGCTHYIESIVQKYGWSGFQVLKNEYAYYTLMGKHGVEIDQLEHHKPLVITMPHWTYCDIHPGWSDILKICTERQIDIHIDMAWLITAKDIALDLGHPAIKSIGLSLSKYGLQWSRVGLRFSRQKSMDSVTIFNDYYHDTNTVMTSIGHYWINNLERDYLWTTYGNPHADICQALDVQATKIIHVVKDKATQKSLGVGRLLEQSAPHSI